MITAHNFSVSLGDGELSNGHEPARLLRYVLQEHDLRTPTMVGGYRRPRGCKRTAFYARPKLIDNTGDTHDPDPQQTFRPGSFDKQREYCASDQE